MSKETHQGYHSFLVRCWLIEPETAGKPARWRFELREVPAEAQKQRFSNLEQLQEFVSAKLAEIATNRYRDNDSEENWKGGRV